VLQKIAISSDLLFNPPFLFLEQELLRGKLEVGFVV
jgi:hypothetical protein